MVIITIETGFDAPITKLEVGEFLKVVSNERVWEVSTNDVIADLTWISAKKIIETRVGSTEVKETFVVTERHDHKEHIVWKGKKIERHLVVGVVDANVDVGIGISRYVKDRRI